MKVGRFLLLCPVLTATLLYHIEALNQSSLDFIPPSNIGINNINCGKRLRLNPRIIRGEESEPHSSPWFVSIQTNNKHVCGASLITDRHILTKSHCLRKDQLNDTRALLGKHRLYEKEATEQNIGVKKFTTGGVRFSGKAPPELGWIAVAQLDKPAVINQYVSTICLATPDDEVEEGKVLTIIGFGEESHPEYVSHDVLNISPPSPYLKQVDERVINNERCANLIFPTAKEGNVTYRVVAGYPAGPDILCTQEINGQGHSMSRDEGGPLIGFRDDKGCRAVGGLHRRLHRYYKASIQYGLSVYSVPRSGDMGYTKVSHFYDWIVEQVKILQ